MRQEPRRPLKAGERLLWLGILLALMLAWVWLAACGRSGTDATADDGENAAVPLPTAYPRVYEYPDSFREVRVGKVTLSVNAAAQVDSAASAFNISYPRYGATVYVGVNAAAGADDSAFAREWGNRVQRITLNLNGATARKTTEAPGHTPFALYRAETVVLTPVQAVGGDPAAGTVISVAAFMDGWQNRQVPYDSVRPVVDILERDVLRLVSTARYER